MIKTFFTIDDLGMSEKAFGNNPTDGARKAESPKSCSNGSEAVEGGNEGASVITADTCDSRPSRKRSQTDSTPVSADEPAKKLQKIGEQGTESTVPAVGTEEAILERDSVIMAGTCDSSPSRKRSRTDSTPVSADEPVKKQQKIDEQGTESTVPAVATEEAILELAESRNGVSHSLRSSFDLNPIYVVP
jgi:hypothetical protein